MTLKTFEGTKYLFGLSLDGIMVSLFVLVGQRPTVQFLSATAVTPVRFKQIYAGLLKILHHVHRSPVAPSSRSLRSSYFAVLSKKLISDENP